MYVSPRAVPNTGMTRTHKVTTAIFAALLIWAIMAHGDAFLGVLTLAGVVAFALVVAHPLAVIGLIIILLLVNR